MWDDGTGTGKNFHTDDHPSAQVQVCIRSSMFGVQRSTFTPPLIGTQGDSGGIEAIDIIWYKVGGRTSNSFSTISSGGHDRGL